MDNIKNGIIQVKEIYGIPVIIDLIPLSNKKANPNRAMVAESVTNHNTGNKNADAESHTNLVDSWDKYTSWHLTLGFNHKKELVIYQEIRLDRVAYHAGDGYYGIGNTTSIAIEMCEDDMVRWNEVRSAGIKLNVWLQENISTIKKIVPHQKWTEKWCPHVILEEKRGFQGFLDDIESFKSSRIDYTNKQVEVVNTNVLNVREIPSTSNNTPLKTCKKGNRFDVIDKVDDKYKIGGSMWYKVKDGANIVYLGENYCKLVDKIIEEPIVAPKIIKNEKNIKSEYIETVELMMIKTKPENLGIRVVGVTMSASGNYGINGSFFNVKDPSNINQQWCLAINNCNYVTGSTWYATHHLRGYGQSVFTLYKDGTLGCPMLRTVYDYKKSVRFAIGGVGLNNDPAKQGFFGDFSDVLRETYHTAIVYDKQGYAYLIVTKIKCNYAEFKIMIETNVKDYVDGVMLDSGGSSSIVYKNNILDQGRRLGTIIYIKEL